MRLNDKYFLNPAHLELAKARYFLKDENGNVTEEDINDVFVRVVDYLYKDDPVNKEEALRLRQEKKIIDAGRPLAQAGTDTKNLYNCFVIGFGDDKVDGDTREAISEFKRKHFNIQSKGGGTGANFSVLRPRGSVCKSNQSHSSGAVGFITDISYQSSNIQQGGNRSGANLAALEDWHPDLHEFITKKSSSNWENVRKFATIFDEDAFAYFQWANPYQWQMFNVSTFLSDKFMEEVVKNSKAPWKLEWKGTEWKLWRFKNSQGPTSGRAYAKEIIVTAPNEEIAKYKASSEIPFFNVGSLELIGEPFRMTATEWFRLICQNAWEDGCPGVVFADLARRFHNGEYFNPIQACNPCAEQFLPLNSVCCLSSIILPTFFVNGEFDFEGLGLAVRQTVRGLDNITTISRTDVPEIDANALNERRIGLGTTGIAELLILAGLKYSSQKGRNFVAKILECIRDAAYNASIELAKERGPFPAFDYEGYSKSEFFKTLPKEIRDDIKKFGIRNVTILTQPPVGTTGTMIGFSQGCEPYFAMCFMRNSRIGTFKDGSPAFIKWLDENNIDYSSYNYDMSELKSKIEVPEYFEEAHNISWEDHLKMQAVFAKYVDSAVSKTINLPNEATVDDVENAYIQAYKLGIKSTTIYRDGSKQQILQHISAETSKVRPQSILSAHAPKRPDSLECDIHHTSVKGEKWTVLVGMLNNSPYEIFCAPQDAFELSDKYKNGKLIKDGKASFYLDTGDFKIKNISKCLKTDEHRMITRLLSTCLRHGVSIAFINEQVAKVDGTVVDFSKAILRVLRKYESFSTSAQKGLTCSSCGSSNVILNSGCPECLDCGVSKCG